jgi:hypothetical protein
MKLPNEVAKQNHLGLACGLFLLSLESDQLDAVKVDGQKRVVDRGGQISLIPALFTKQLVQTH